MTTKGEGQKKISNSNCDMENFKMVAEHFNQDLREFWSRANFYLVTNAGLLSAFLLIYPALIGHSLLIVMLMPILGILIATLWFLVLRGSLYWIELWRLEMVNLSKELDRYQCYAKIESSLVKNKSKSPSYLTQFLPLFFIAAWIMILIVIIFGVFCNSGGVQWIPAWNSTAT